jgi:hypothetical protein
MTDFDSAMSIPPEWLRKDRQYSWVLDDKRFIPLALGKEYEFVRATDPEGQHFKKGDPRVAQDGLIRVGDAVLMRAPLDVVSKRQAARRRRNREAIENVKKEYHDAVQSQGVATFEEPFK